MVLKVDKDGGKDMTIDGRDSYSEFRHRNLPQTVPDDINRALGKLHDAQLVYGDTRRPNIMVVKNQNPETTMAMMRAKRETNGTGS
jgi:tRNA A-37 threonylcarbamoyl transferase component Bud32